MTEEADPRFISMLPRGLWGDALKAAEAIAGAGSVTVASHIDADGIAAASVAAIALSRAGKAANTLFFKKLDDEAIKRLKETGSDLVWFTDLGSGSLSKIDGFPAVVTDHHVPDPSARSPAKTGQSLLTDFGAPPHVNPHLHGLSGANEVSGAGMTFVVSLALAPRNSDLAYLAVLGGVGDLQDQKTGRLEGLNRKILAVAEETGFVSTVEDIRYFGRETRPIHKLLEFSSDPTLPRITGSQEGALQFLAETGVDLKNEDGWRTWSDLSEAEKTVIIDSLVDYLRRCGRPEESIRRLTGEAYVFTKEARRTPLRDAKEFATLMNACGRHGKAELGMAICKGDRESGLAQGLALLRNHRSALSEALSIAKDAGVTRLRNIQFFDAGADIEDTIIGTVAGMLLGSEGMDRSAPMVAFADSREYSDPPKVKASSRGTQELVAMGVDLSAAIRRAAEKVGGVGGGHNIAAGATIPSDRKEEFLQALDELIGTQLGTAKKGRRQV